MTDHTLIIGWRKSVRSDSGGCVKVALAASEQPDRAGESSRSGRVSTSGPAPVSGGDRAVQGRTQPEESARPGEGRSWVLEFPPGMTLVTSNARGHWAKHAPLLAAIKDTAIVLCRQQKIPRLRHAAFVLEYQPPAKGRAAVREAHNLTPTAKAGIDGVVSAGVLPDDSDFHVPYVTFRRGVKHPGGRVRLHILEVLETPSP